MQIKMDLNGGRWGGLRKGAGRKKGNKVSHAAREKVAKRTPLHVTFKYKTSVRNKTTLKLLKRAIQNARSHGLKVLHYSFQSNHIHVLIEAQNNEILTRGMRSLTITFAKGLKQGRIQLERYHLHVLRTINEVRHAIYYVLFNEQKHLEFRTYTTINDYSSLLSVKEALFLIQKFAKEKKMMIKVEKAEFWNCDEAQSFIWHKGWNELFS